MTLRIYILIIFLLLFSISLTHAQAPKTLKLIFAGDIMGHDTQIESALKQGGDHYDYSSCFEHIAPYISSADIAIGNLEVTLAGSPYKGYPAFSSPDALASEIKKAGFDILVNANNHAIDRRKKGLERTLYVLDSLSLVQTGVFKNSYERNLEYPLIIEKNGIRLALLNYTYGTNGIKVSAPNIVNYIDTITIQKDLEKAASAEPDFTIILMHWGLEYQRTENEVQKQMAHFLFDHGADAIIGSHPHVVQPIRDYNKGRLVVFSMGNMISNQRKRYTDGGILVNLTLEKTDSTRITDYAYLPVWVHKPETEKGTAFSLVPAAMDSTHWEKMLLTPDDATSMKLFLRDTRENLPETKEVHPDWIK
ncbi:MAG: CapA family protein [Bacteroidales bacterium]|jgi:poly-gamma-glutamate capsule biosynthesis protein CapA/YwtB (metallophosphatase superfamily)|nr:CapA family protein [Bacteroidales bacterium]